MVGIGTYISLYELRQPAPERRDRLARRIVSIPAETVTELVIENPEASLTLGREGTDWRLHPRGIRADAGLVRELLGYTDALTAERVLSAADHEPLDRSAYGLDPPVARLRLVTDEGSTTLLFGETTAVENNRYVQRTDRPEVFVVSSRLFDRINQDAEAFRDRRLLRFDSLVPNALALDSTDGTVRLAWRDGDWYLSEPVDDLADRSEVNALLSRLSRIEIQRFLDGTWGEEPTVEIALTHSEPPTTTTLRFGDPLADDETLVYAARSDEPKLLYAIATEDLQALLKDPSSLRAQACFDFFTSRVNKAEVTWQDAGWTIERAEGAWRVSFDSSTVAQDRIPSEVEGFDSAQDARPEPVEGRVTDPDVGLDTQQVERFLSKLADLRVSAFLETPDEGLQPFGLSEPAGTLAVWTTEDEEPQRLLIGRPLSESASRYGLIEKRQALIELPEFVAELLATTPDELRPLQVAPALRPLTEPDEASET